MAAVSLPAAVAGAEAEWWWGSQIREAGESAATGAINGQEHLVVRALNGPQTARDFIWANLLNQVQLSKKNVLRFY